MISFTDDMTRCSQVYFMNSKSEALDKLKKYQASVEGTSGELIRVLHTERGGEYMSMEFKWYLVLIFVCAKYYPSTRVSRV